MEPQDLARLSRLLVCLFLLSPCLLPSLESSRLLRFESGVSSPPVLRLKGAHIILPVAAAAVAAAAETSKGDIARIGGLVECHKSPRAAPVFPLRPTGP